MIERKREREKRRASTEELERRIAKRLKQLGYPLSPDITSTERHYSRSVKIRNATYKMLWELATTEETFSDIIVLSYMIANRSKSAVETARRWMEQYTCPNGDFQFIDREHRVGWRKGK